MGQLIKVYTEHNKCIQDALGLSSDRVYPWILLSEEYGHKNIHIKDIIADALLCVDYGPAHNNKEMWLTLIQYWCHYILLAISEQPAIHLHKPGVCQSQQRGCHLPPDNNEIMEAQQMDPPYPTHGCPHTQHLVCDNTYTTELVENTQGLWKDKFIVLPTTLQHQAMTWPHHYFQHPGATQLEKTLSAAIY